MIHNVILCYDTMWNDIISCEMIWYDMIWYDMIWYHIILYHIISYHIILYYITRYDMVWYDTMWCDMISNVVLINVLSFENNKRYLGHRTRTIMQHSEDECNLPNYSLFYDNPFFHFYTLCKCISLLFTVILRVCCVWGDLGKTLDRSCHMGPCIVVAEGTYVRTVL